MRIALVCTQGGHLTELLQLVDAFDGHEYFIVTHHSSRDTDIEKISKAYFSKSISANPFRMILAFLNTLKIFLREKPDLVISSGAEIAIPFFIFGKFFTTKTIYIESWCRINTSSYTGRIVYPFADHFLVQWPEMLNVYGKKAEYWGAVI